MGLKKKTVDQKLYAQMKGMKIKSIENSLGQRRAAWIM